MSIYKLIEKYSKHQSDKNFKKIRDELIPLLSRDQYLAKVTNNKYIEFVTPHTKESFIGEFILFFIANNHKRILISCDDDDSVLNYTFSSFHNHITAENRKDERSKVIKTINDYLKRYIESNETMTWYRSITHPNPEKTKKPDMRKIRDSRGFVKKNLHKYIEYLFYEMSATLSTKQIVEQLEQENVFLKVRVISIDEYNYGKNAESQLQAKEPGVDLRSKIDEAIRRISETMNASEKTVLIGVYREETLADIADKIGKSIGSVHSIKKESFRKMRRIIRDFELNNEEAVELIRNIRKIENKHD